MAFESFLADQAAEVVRFSVVSYLEFGCVIVKDCSTHRVSVHYFLLSSGMRLFFYLFIVNGEDAQKGSKIG